MNSQPNLTLGRYSFGTASLLVRSQITEQRSICEGVLVESKIWLRLHTGFATTYYWLELTTRYSKGQLTKEPRTSRFDKVLNVPEEKA